MSDARAMSNSYGLGRRSNLSLVAWGRNGFVSAHDDRGALYFLDKCALWQKLFVRGEITDPFGRQSLQAVQISWKMKNYVEPESEILDHSVSTTTQRSSFC